MSRFALSVIVLSILCWSAPVGAQTSQTRPNFAGTWSSPSGATVSISQDGSRMTVMEGNQTSSYNLDGSASTSSKNSSGVTVSSQVSWMQSAMLVTTTTTTADGSWKDYDIYTLDFGPKLTVIHLRTQSVVPMMATTATVYTPPAVGPGGTKRN